MSSFRLLNPLFTLPSIRSTVFLSLLLLFRLALFCIYVVNIIP